MMRINVESVFTIMILLGLLVTLKSEVYIVTIEGEPVISYKGGVNGFKATAVESDETLDVTSDLVISFSDHLEQRHDTLLETLFDNGSYKKLYSYKHLINGFAVHISPEQSLAQSWDEIGSKYSFFSDKLFKSPTCPNLAD